MPQHIRPPRRVFRWLFLYQPHFITPSSILLPLFLIISPDIFKLFTYWQFVIRVHCSAELHTLILKQATARAWPFPGQGKSTWKELSRSDPEHGGSWGATVKPALSKRLSLTGWQNSHPWFHTHHPLPADFYLMLWGAEEWGHTVIRFRSPEPDPVPGRLLLTRGAAQLPCVSWWASLCGLKTLEEFCSSLQDALFSSLPPLT